MRRLFGCPDIVSLTEKFLMARNFYRIFTENNPVMGDSKTFGIPEAKGLNRNSVFFFNLPKICFFPAVPFIKRPEEKKGKGHFFFFFFFLSLESSRAVISVALISRLIPRTPADYVYICNERTMNLVRLCSGKRSYHTQPWNQVYDFMRRWFPIAVFISNTPTLLAGYQPSPCHMAIWD